MRRRTLFLFALLLTWVSGASAQMGVTTRPTNLRRDPSTHHKPIRLFGANKQLTLLSSTERNGYYHAETPNDTGWVWARNVRIETSTVTTPPTDSAALTAITIGPPVPGSMSLAGCGDGLWHHVYNPYRLLEMNECVTVSGTIVDATNGRNHDGVRHEPDGDTHGWLRLDPQFTNLLNNGNVTAEGGNLVFEIVCHFHVTQADAKPACSTLSDHTAIPPIGAHVRMTGTFVQDTNHQRWNEIHPVSRIEIIP